LLLLRSRFFALLLFRLVLRVAYAACPKQ